MLPRIGIITALICLLACGSVPEEQHRSEEMKSPQVQQADEAVHTKPPASDELNYIGHMENNKLYHRSLKEYEEKGRERMENIYRVPLPNAEAYYLLQKENLLEQRRKSKFKITQPRIPEGWETPQAIAYNTESADVVYRYGDMDNLGYGWPLEFDPFSGESTPPHDYPFYPEPDDPSGTDRIMVISAFNKENTPKGSRRDGYTTSTERPHNLPQPLLLEYDLKGKTVQHALIQLFVDDFQPKTYKSKFQVWINDKEAGWISSYLNELKQGGPIGKLLSIQVLPEFIADVQSGKMKILIDGQQTNTGDGFAIDFVRLLINPKHIAVGTLEGKVIDAKTRQPIAQALLKASGANEAETGADGAFRLTDIPLGMVVVQAAKAGYKNNVVVENLEQTAHAPVLIKLEPETNKTLEEELDEKGKIDLYGIYFDTDQATLQPESEKTLRQLLALVKENGGRRLEIGGHTDSQGNDAYNLQLSEQRAAAVLNWLKQHDAPVNNLRSKGYGETMPVADNQSPAGRALNRRVEIKIVNESS